MTGRNSALLTSVVVALVATTALWLLVRTTGFGNAFLVPVPKTHNLTCRLVANLPDDAEPIGRWAPETEKPIGDKRAKAVVAGSKVHLHVPVPRGRGVLYLPTFAPVRVAWTEHGCLPSRLPLEPADTWLQGTVTQRDKPLEGAVVSACGNEALTDNTGQYKLVVPNRPCEVRARRGRSSSEVVEARPRRGQSVRLDLEVQKRKKGPPTP